MKRRNPSDKYQHPGDPEDILGVGELVLFVDTSSEVLCNEERRILIGEACAAVEGHYRRDMAIENWAKFVHMASRTYMREIRNTWDDDALRGHAFSRKTLAEAAFWYVSWSEWQLFGRGLNHLLKLSQGDTSKV